MEKRSDTELLGESGEEIEAVTLFVIFAFTFSAFVAGVIIGAVYSRFCS